MKMNGVALWTSFCFIHNFLWSSLLIHVHLTNFFSGLHVPSAASTMYAHTYLSDRHQDYSQLFDRTNCRMLRSSFASASPMDLGIILWEIYHKEGAPATACLISLSSNRGLCKMAAPTHCLTRNVWESPFPSLFTTSFNLLNCAHLIVKKGIS